jgi:hypothetical protein
MLRLNNFFQSSLVVWRPSSGTWYVWNSRSAPSALGLPGDVPLVIPGFAGYSTYDGLALWRPTQGIIVPVSSTGSFSIPAQQLTAPASVPF